MNNAPVNLIEQESAVAKIPLTQGKTALIDAADFSRVSAFRWIALRNGRNWYAMRWPGIYMHRLILGVREVDHINGNGLDNRRCNLRPATRSQQMQNSRKRLDTSSLYKGVYWDKTYGIWRAQIRINGRAISLGRFDNEVEAAKAYDKAAKEAFSEYARTNF
jgi:hypothetical protein